MGLRKRAAIMLITASIAACGGNPYDESIDPNASPTVNNSTGSISLNRFSVDGSSGGQSVGINSGVDSGLFTLTWEVNGDEDYDAQLYLSEDDVAANSSDDEMIFSRSCGSGLECGFDVDDYPCYFTTTNYINCGTSPLYDSQENISFFLDELPKDGFLILKVCNQDDSDCDEKDVEIQLQ